MTCNLEIKKFAGAYYLGIRTKDVKPEDLGATLAETLPRVFDYVQKNGITPITPPLTLYHCHDGTTGTFDIQGGCFIAEKVAGDGDITCGEIPAGETVSTVHMGPYDKLGESHEMLWNWVKEQNRASNNPCWEIYLNDPESVKPDECQTEVVYFLQPASST